MAGVLLCVALPVAIEAQAQQLSTFEALRKVADEQTALKIEGDLLIEGFVVSDPTSENRDQNFQRYFRSIKDRNCLAFYLESLDGRYGFRCVLTEPGEAYSFPQYSRVVLNLKGATLSKSVGESYSIEELTRQALVSCAAGTAADIPVKERYIHEITAEDINTFVTVKECEFVFKDGSFSNVYENYTQKSEFNKFGNGMMDGWASLLCDKRGSELYMFLNTKVPWRRDGSGVPQGAGEVKGILVNTPMPRYGVGNFFGVAAIRPMTREDIALSQELSQSGFQSIVEWNWNDNVVTFRTEKGSLKVVSKEAILADVGEGTLRSMTGGVIIRGRDYNNLTINDGTASGSQGDKGMVMRGAMRIKTKACNWWNWAQNSGRGIELNFSTEGLAGENLVVAFSFGAGEVNAKSSMHFPVYWGVEYSTDGETFHRVECDPITLRSLPWWYNNDIGGATYPTSEEAGLGFTEHLVKLPAELLGCKNVTVRIVPITKRAATLAMEQSDKAALRENLLTETYVSFGSVVVRYN